MPNDGYRYVWKSKRDMTAALWADCASLFSGHYGLWGEGGRRPGKQISLSAERVAEFMPDEGWVVMAREGETLVGYALGIRHVVNGCGTVDWVTQLVVHTAHRNKGVATWLLFTFWGFSDHHAWGLVTSNPYAVRALERITHRRCYPAEIEAHQGELDEVGREIPYVQGKRMSFGPERSAIQTEFYISHALLPGKLEAVKKTGAWRLGTIGEGEEWLAFTFRDQGTETLSPEDLETMLKHSEKTAQLAYERMAPGPLQVWTKYTQAEAEFAVDAAGLHPGAKVLDLGCGGGRHTLALARLGFQVTGLDFVESAVHQAEAAARQEGLANASFVVGDARAMEADLGLFDAVLCLYDVVGSFPEQADNQALVATIARCLKPGGKALVSVLNMHLTRKLARHVASVRATPDALQRLRPSSTMQTTGAIFNPDFYLLDDETGVVYRKEQFDGDGKPPAEFVVRDRRYTQGDITRMCEEAGLRLCWQRPVPLGSWRTELEPEDDRAKELLFLVEKP